MNKHSFNSYLCNNMAPVFFQHRCCADACLSQHSLIVSDMYFDFSMGRMMQA
ncbi:MAG: hypothetical protein L0G39_00710 [Chryseobacterium sp.]|nr:hypothetical protein [Chryseobacterium sp.]